MILGAGGPQQQQEMDEARQPQQQGPSGPMISHQPPTQVVVPDLSQQTRDGLKDPLSQGSKIDGSVPMTPQALQRQAEALGDRAMDMGHVSIDGYSYKAAADKIDEGALYAEFMLSGHPREKDIVEANRALQEASGRERTLTNVQDAHSKTNELANNGVPGAGNAGKAITSSVDNYFGTDQDFRVDGTVALANKFSSRPEAFNPNSEAGRELLGGMDRLSNRTGEFGAPMTRDQVAAEVNRIGTIADAAISRFENQAQIQLQNMLTQIQILTSGGKTNEALEKTKAEIEKLLESYKKSKKSDEEKEKDVAEVEAKMQKAAFKTIE